MQILLSNDDGLEAHGLQRLAKRLRREHDVVIYAPADNKSGASHSITLRKPVRVTEVREGEFSVAGTPADAMYMAVSQGVRPDLVISGTNAGGNLGCDTLYSGTVAAAMEARFLSVPSIALSLCCAPGDRANHDNYETACDVVEQLIEQLADWRELPITALNVNVPDLPTAGIKGWRWTRLGRRSDPLPAQPWPDVESAWQIGLAGEPADYSPDTDFHAVGEGFVSLTPLQQDLTSHSVLAAAESASIEFSPLEAAE